MSNLDESLARRAAQSTRELEALLLRARQEIARERDRAGRAEAECGRLRGAIAAAIASAEAVSIARHRGTDLPRQFIVILRDAVDRAREGGGDER